MGERRARATTAIRSDAWARLRVSNSKKEALTSGGTANYSTLNGISPGWALSVELPAPQSFRVSLEIGLAEAAVPFASPVRTVKTLRRSGHLFRRRWLRAVFPLRDRAGKFDIGKAARSAMPS